MGFVMLPGGRGNVPGADWQATGQVLVDSGAADFTDDAVLHLSACAKPPGPAGPV